MRLTKKGGTVTLTREKDEPRVKNESDLFYRLRNVLKAKGEDVIKKEMSKDGHMISDDVFYVRTRKVNVKGAYGIYDPYYATRDAAAEYNKGAVTFNVASFE